MDRRQLLAGLGAAAFVNAEAAEAQPSPAYLEVKFWRLHNSPEDQLTRVSTYLQNGLAPALSRAGAKLAGAFSVAVGPGNPSYVTLTQYESLGAMQTALEHLRSDGEHIRALETLSSGTGLPFVRVESSLLRSFDVMPQPAIGTGDQAGGSSRLFELRMYESQSFLALERKVKMFNDVEAGIFKKLGFRPVFFGQTIVGANQPNLMYMISYDDMAARSRLWQSFGSDPDWKKVSTRPELKDSEIVANINNWLLEPLSFSPVR